jgi:transcriptional regulator with XRE-family HTH domain
VISHAATASIVERRDDDLALPGRCRAVPLRISKGTRVARPVGMETPPGKVIRSLRQALDMTQAEFAHAAGWSPSTISSWERGTTQPSRLAFKTIRAFAEERGVRYSPKGDGTVAPTGNLPVLRLGSRLPTPMTLDADGSFPPSSGEREESFGSRRWTEVAASRPTVEIGARGASIAERPEWHVEARLQLKVGTSGERLRRTGYVAASLLALVIGIGAGVWLRSGVGSSSAPRTAERPSIEEPVSAPRVAKAPPPVEVDELALTAFTVAPAAGPPIAADQHAEIAIAPVPAMPPPSYARLESIVSLDGVRRATFRMGDRSIALVEGDAIGGRAVGEIANSEVMLVGEGAPKRVRLGAEIPVE